MRCRSALGEYQVYDEPIEVLERRYGFAPCTFRWHGHDFRVHTVEKGAGRPVAGLRPARLGFCLHCEEGLFEVHLRLVSNTWHLWSARWARGCPTVAGRA